MTGAVGFGLSGGLRLTAPQALRLLEAAHASGLSPVLVTEVAGLGAPELAAAFAARNPGVSTGTGIVPLGSRTTAAIAMGARTVAHLTGTPYLLGVGVSTPQIVTGWHGEDHDATVATAEARLVDLRSRLRGDRYGSFSLPGDADADVRVLLGALGPRMVDVGMRVADGVIINHTPPAALPVRSTGDRTVLAYLWVHACEDADARARRDVVSYAMAPPYARHLTRLGWGDAVAEVRALHAEGRLRDAPDRLPDDLVAALFATPADLADRLSAFHDAGVTPVVMPVTGADPVAGITDLLAAMSTVDVGTGPTGR